MYMYMYIHDSSGLKPDVDGALTFTHVCVDSSRTVLEHHRPFTPFISVLIAAELHSLTAVINCPSFPH